MQVSGSRVESLKKTATFRQLARILHIALAALETGNKNSTTP